MRAAYFTGQMAAAVVVQRNFATIPKLTASIHQRQKGQEVILVQPIHELLRSLDGSACRKG